MGDKSEIDLNQYFCEALGFDGLIVFREITSQFLCPC